MKSLFTKKPKLKTILIVLLALAGLSAVVGGSFAAYTSQAYQRGVARNRDNETVRFMSNYLQACANTTDSKDYAGRTVLFSDSTSGEISVDIFVYNYANGNENLVSQKDITYNMSIMFESSNTGNSYSVKVEDGDVQTVQSNKFEQSNVRLAGRRASSHKYTVTFPASDLDKLKITAVATPTVSSLSATNNQKLAAVIVPCVGSSTNEFSYSSKFIDQIDGNSPKDFAGFNYEVSISSGVADATLTWNTAIVEIDKFFLINLGKSDKEIESILAAGTLTFTMNQTKGTGDYLIPFYIKDKRKITDDWNCMGITFTATKREQSTTTTDTP